MMRSSVKMVGCLLAATLILSGGWDLPLQASTAAGGSANGPENPGASSGSRRTASRLIGARGRRALEDGIWRRAFPRPDERFDVVVTPVDQGFSAEITGHGTLLNASTLPFYVDGGCAVSMDVQPAPHGFDLVYRVSNPTGQPQALPTLQIPSLNMEGKIDFLHHATECEWKTLDASAGQAVWSPTEEYPRQLYAPAVIARDTQKAIGLSLEYDMMGWEHSIRTYIGRARTGTTYGNGWNAKFFLDGQLPAGGARKYVVNVRVEQPGEWIHTLSPYREFLLRRYGKVKYVQNLDPVFGVQIGDSGRLGSENARGFNGYRADQNGWQRDVTEILNFAPTAGYRRVMVWTPSGVYKTNTQNNFPPNFMSEWSSAMERSGLEWQRIGAGGLDLMFWWGRAGQVADRWDDPVLDKFDPDNQAQRDEMLTEWSLARQRGVKGVGLDAITQMDGWDIPKWIDQLRETVPGATVVAEPGCFDVLNLKVPVVMYADNFDSGPMYLADYLVPGREIWVLLRGADETQARAEEFIRQGLTVIMRGRQFTANDLQPVIDQVREDSRRVQADDDAE